MLPLTLSTLTQTWYSTTRGCPRARETRLAFNSSLDGCRDGEATLAAVRCCSSPRGAGAKCISVCGDESMAAGAQPSRSAPKTCIEAFAATASQAATECKAQGMRLCRLEELHAHDSACRKSGCSMDAGRVWTADSCRPTPADLGRQRREAAEAQALSARLLETRIDPKATLLAPLLAREQRASSANCDGSRRLAVAAAAAADTRGQGEAREPNGGAPSAISIAIATCRRAPHLKRVLPLYLHQQRVSDVVVTDDCATDARELTTWAASGAVSRAEAAKLTIVANERQLWPFANKYAAVKLARGPWVAVLDSDNTFLDAYFETLFELWKRLPPSPKVVYAPQRLLRPKAGPDGHLAPHLSIGFDFSSLVGKVVDAKTWASWAKSSASAVLNTGNNVVHRQTALRAWRPYLEHPDMSAKDVWLDSQLMNRLMVERGARLCVVPNLEYVHPASADSFYKRGTEDPASQRWFRSANLKSLDAERSVAGAAETDAEAAWSTFQTAAVRCCKVPTRQLEARCMSVCEADQRLNVAAASGDTVWEPKLGTDGLSATPVAAAAECSARGWRLCKRAELGACCKTGCGMDKLYVWTAEGGAAMGCERRG